MKIHLKVAELIELVEGVSSLDHDFLVHNFSSLENAGPSDIVVYLPQEEGAVFDSLSLDSIKNSKAGLILASKKYVPEKDYIIVEDPLLAFQKIVKAIELKEQSVQDEISKEYPHAFVSEAAEIGKNVVIEPGAVIKSGAKIGDRSKISSQAFVGKDCVVGLDVVLYPGVKVLDRCLVGNNTIIHSNSVVGSDGYGFRGRRDGMWKVPQVGVVRIGSFVEIGANVTIDRAAFDETVIGDGVKLDNLIHIAHNVKIGPHTAIIAQTGIAGGVEIGMGCQIGGQVGIKDHVKIGNGVKIVSKSAVMKSLKDGEVVAGIPAMPFNTFKRITVMTMKLPEIFKLKDSFTKFSERMNAKRSFWKRLLGRF